MKLITWLEEQIGRLTNFLGDAKGDNQKFDEHIQGEVEKYNNKQCGKAAIVGFCLGVIVCAVLDKIF